MNAQRILLPLDLRNGTTDALLYLQKMAEDRLFSVTLLHVVDLNIVVPDRSLYPGLCAESRAVLRRLSLRFFGAEDAANVSVRVGRADEQILAEARSMAFDLILLSNSQRRGWSFFFRSGTAENVMRAAPCPTLIVPSRRSERRALSRAGEPQSVPAPRLHPTWA